jgi:hypothetical protein
VLVDNPKEAIGRQAESGSVFTIIGSNLKFGGNDLPWQEKCLFWDSAGVLEAARLHGALGLKVVDQSEPRVDPFPSDETAFALDGERLSPGSRHSGCKASPFKNAKPCREAVTASTTGSHPLHILGVAA